MGEQTPNLEVPAFSDPPDDDEIVETMEQVRAIESPFEKLLSPRSRVAILDVLVEEGGRALTVQEMVDRSDQITTSSFNRQKDDILEYGVIVEAGKRGNAQTYALNADHPVAQALKMVDNLLTWGKTPLLVDEEYLGQPGEE